MMMGLALPMLVASGLGAIVSLSDASDTASAVYDGVFQPDISAGYDLESDGDVVTLNGGDIADWIAPKASAGGNYEVRATLLSGSTPTGTLGSWLALSSTRSWSVEQSGGPGITSCSLLVEIRPAGGGATLASAVITLTAELT